LGSRLFRTFAMISISRCPTILGALLCISVSGCSLPFRGATPDLEAPATVASVTPAQRDLLYLPPPPQPIPIAVYGFGDQTGQLRAAENFQSLSRAVTQGGTSILIGALRSAGNGNWFTVVERERLDNVLRERQIIREMRQYYLGEQQTPPEVLPSLIFAGITLEGGIISFDTNVQTGGIGARLLGIGGSTQYRTNKITIYLRAVSVRTGEVLSNVVTEVEISSVGVSGGAFRYVTFDKLLEAEVGVTHNEPTQLGVQQAIERAVYALIMEGATPGARQLWSFADQAAGQPWLERYSEEKRRALAEGFRRAPPLPAAAAPAPEPAPATETTQ
jgi:curli production assembly/transport component CsgG